MIGVATLAFWLAPSVVSAVGLALKTDKLPQLEGRRAQSYRQSMTNYKDMQYYGNMTIGGQTLQVVLDTGSVDFAVLSEKCRNWCGAREHFHASQSETYENGSLTSVLSYGSGSLLGKEAYETVRLGPLETSAAPFWEIYDASMPLLMRSGFEAIIGLGPAQAGSELMAPGSSANEHAFAILFQKLGVQQYSVCLGKGQLSQGFLTWNDHSPEDYPGSFVQLSIQTDSGYWMVLMQDVRIGDKLIACSEGCGAVVDSGTSLLAAPFDAYFDFTSFVQKFGADCANIATLPDLHFKLDGVPFSLTADAYMGEVRGEVHDDIASHFRKHGSAEKSCQAALMHVSMDSSLGPLWILGMPFFRKYYTVFSQPSEGLGARLYVSPASEDCMPATGTESQLVSTDRGHRGRMQLPARTIDSSALHVPLWLEKTGDKRQQLFRQGHSLARSPTHTVVPEETLQLPHERDEVDS